MSGRNKQKKQKTTEGATRSAAQCKTCAAKEDTGPGAGEGGTVGGSRVLAPPPPRIEALSAGVLPYVVWAEASPPQAGKRERGLSHGVGLCSTRAESQ